MTFVFNRPSLKNAVRRSEASPNVRFPVAEKDRSGALGDSAIDHSGADHQSGVVKQDAAAGKIERTTAEDDARIGVNKRQRINLQRLIANIDGVAQSERQQDPWQ